MSSSTKLSVKPTKLPGVLLLQPTVHSDERGFFLEGYNERDMEAIGICEHFVQDNHSYSIRNVVRGLHYQLEHPQGKLVRVIHGGILDVAVDLRRSSRTFGQWHSEVLSGENNKILWMPVGIAHGFRVLSECAHVLYKATEFYDAASERTIDWNDKCLSIDWQVNAPPVLSTKDRNGMPFESAPKFD